MEGTQTALINSGDTGPYMKLLPGKDLNSYGTQDESSYVELDNVLEMKSEGARTLKVMLTGDSNHLGIFQSKGDKSIAAHTSASECELNLTNFPNKDNESDTKKCSEDITTDVCVVGEFCYSEPSVAQNSNGDLEGCSDGPEAITGPHTEIVRLKVKDPGHSRDDPSQIEELQYTDMYLYKTCESEECESVVLSDHIAPGTEDESHFITTHEIQLTELDHEVDGDFEQESCVDIEDDNLVYSFVDYASFDSDETIEADIEDDGSLAPVSSDQALSDNTAPCPASTPVVSTKHKKDQGDSDKCGSSDESLSKAFQDGNSNSAGQIQLSIKTTSRAINKSSSGKETENASYTAKTEDDWSRYVYKTKDIKGDGTCGTANCFIPAPGRVHFGRKLKGRDFEYSSGASSSVSELDDADKEVRNLTARAFKSLACPYFDAISLSASSDSSVSECGQGVNNWSAHTGGHRLFSQKTLTSTFQATKTAGGTGIIGYTQAKLNSLFAVNGCFSKAHKASATIKKVEFEGQIGQEQNAVSTSAETEDFGCKVNAEGAERERHAKLANKAGGSSLSDGNTDALPNEQGTAGTTYPCETADDKDSSNKNAIFASSILKNVLSKKMHSEQELMEMDGTQTEDYEISTETLAAAKPQDSQKEYSKTTEPVPIEESLRQTASARAPDTKLDQRNEATSDAAKGSLLPSENSAFTTWKNGEANQTHDTAKPTSLTKNTGESLIDVKAGSSKCNKKSQLFVPKIQSQLKGQEPSKQVPDNNNSTHVFTDQGGGWWKIRGPGYKPGITPRSSEIKISVRTMKDNAKPFNIASLLTPNIEFSSANQVRPGDSSRSRALIASLTGEWAERTPHFMVRDTRDNKYKLLTPIHKVRDVRKLVKSTYHFVSLENQGKNTSADSEEQKASKYGPERRNMALFSPMVIKCQSVNTNSKPDMKRSEHLFKAFRNRPPTIKETLETERSSPPPPADNPINNSEHLQQKASQPSTVSNTKQSNNLLLETQQRLRQDSVSSSNASANTEKKPESKASNKVALEKLQAAVKTMEELYVFDRNEWKRRTEAPHPLTDSQVLPIITSEDRSSPVAAESDLLSNLASTSATGSDTPSTRASKSPALHAAEPAPRMPTKREATVFLKTVNAPGSQEGKGGVNIPPRQSAAFCSKNTVKPVSEQKIPSSSGTAACELPQPHSAPVATKSSESTPVKPAVSSQISHPKCSVEERGIPNNAEADNSDPPPTRASTGTDQRGNYLTIPITGKITDVKQSDFRVAELGQDLRSSRTTSSPTSKPGAPDPASSPSLVRLPFGVETQRLDGSSAPIYQPTLAVASPAGLPQVMCFPLQATPPLPVPQQADPTLQTQRKMLLDPTTGQYYLVDTPISPAIRKLYDLETGQFMDVPAPPQPATPVSLPLSPLSPLVAAAALNPSPYATPTYVIYPSFLPSPTCPASATPSRTPLSRLSVHSEGGGDDSNRGDGGGSAGDVKPVAGLKGDSAHTDIPAAKSPQRTSECGSAHDSKPVISISSRQQGPRIVAPPSFDGTTMSFVVEHR